MNTRQKAHDMPGTTDIYNVVSELWNRAAPGLSQHELEWFKNSTDTAQASLRNFAAILKAIGVNAMCDEKSKVFANNETLARMLFVFSDYARYLEAMVFIGDFAEDQLRCGDLAS